MTHNNESNKFFVLFARGNYSGNGTGNERVYVTANEPRYNQSNEIPKTLPAWLGNTNGISTTVLAGYPTENRAAAGARYYARKYNCGVR
jgi:hypothetical protein